MAFPSISVGDIFNAIKEVRDFIRKCGDTSEIVLAADRDLQCVEVQLGDINTKINDRQVTDQWKSFIKSTFIPLRRDIDEMSSLIKAYSELSNHSPKRVVFTAFKLSSLQQLQHNLEGYVKLWARAYHQFDDEIRTQMASDFGEMLKEQRRGGEILETILQCLKKKGEDTVLDVAKTHDSERRGKWEDELVELGLNRDTIANFMKPVMENVRNINCPNPQPIIINHLYLAGNPNAWPPSSSHNLPQAGEAHQPHIPTPHEAARWEDYSSPNGIPDQHDQEDVTTENKWILCVDKTNGVRSILAQMFLELNRAWIVNTTSRWLFERVDSAGANIRTHFATRYLPSLPEFALTSAESIDRAITELAGPPEHYWSDDYPYEKKTIIDRMKAHQSRGIESRHFETYHYILCFSLELESTLLSLKRAWESEHGTESCTQIILLWVSEPLYTRERALQHVIPELKTAILNFMATKLGWKEPWVTVKGKPKRLGIAQGKERTLMMVLPQEYRARIKGREAELSRETGVKVRLTLEGMYEKHQLVCLTGAKERLRAAEQLIRQLT